MSSCNDWQTSITPDIRLGDHLPSHGVLVEVLSLSRGGHFARVSREVEWLIRSLSRSSLRDQDDRTGT
jgi:hypothetical protein